MSAGYPVFSATTDSISATRSASDACVRPVAAAGAASPPSPFM